MNRNDPSARSDWPEQAGAEKAQAAPVRTGALGLLSAVDIWSTDGVALASPKPAEKSQQNEKPQRNVAAEHTLPPVAPAPVKSPAGESRVVAIETVAPLAPTNQITTNPIPAEPAAPAKIWPPQRLSLALQGGGSFAAFAWGVLDRLLEEQELEFDAISGASAGAVNA